MLDICQSIKNKISSDSEVFYWPDPSYIDDIKHYATTSTTLPICSVEPATSADVATIMKIIRETQVPFGVKGGGHTLNPGFSSTTGIHIAMRRFDKVIYHANNQTVDVDSGLIWDDVYKALDPYNVSVVGGRVSGVGVAGFTLGGGYSWKSNQFGLAIDNVLGYELVSPNGTIVYVTNDSYSDIFFGLKGGFNNFGIVTNFKLRALPQTLVYGGLLIYVDIHKFDNILTALVNFQNNNKDPKAQLLPSFFRQAGLISFTLTVFYDAPTAPTSTFDEFMNISHFGVLKTRSFLSFIKAVPVFITDGMRGRFHTVSVTNLTTRLLQELKNLTIYNTAKFDSRHSSLAVFTAEPFLSTYFDKSQGGAYPHVPSTTPLLPVLVQFGWQLPEDDEFFINEIKLTVDSIMQVVLNEEKNGNGTIQIRYPNYALETTPLSEMYGDNLPRLQSIRKAWDPDNVMNLTGGFKF
ncbi:unnamed protein product [Rotaria magnacalcarata]|uniref:FAD-binding PCMH-type domain-containing protein n=1 Tax=Rotaria magnacalcarata TaxID=392030 RepID=A0A816XYN2_9BILA|nr:unnamed protein product [Rotaria magnacalcarata]